MFRDSGRDVIQYTPDEDDADVWLVIAPKQPGAIPTGLAVALTKDGASIDLPVTEALILRRSDDAKVLVRMDVASGWIPLGTEPSMQRLAKRIVDYVRGGGPPSKRDVWLPRIDAEVDRRLRNPGGEADTSLEIVAGFIGGPSVNTIRSYVGGDWPAYVAGRRRRLRTR
jgi:hypothetical protein